MGCRTVDDGNYAKIKAGVELIINGLALVVDEPQDTPESVVYSKHA